MSSTETTVQGRIKERAAYYVNRFMASGASHTKAKLYAVILVEELSFQYDKMFQGSGNTDTDDARHSAYMRTFEDLINAIKAF